MRKQLGFCFARRKVLIPEQPAPGFSAFVGLQKSPEQDDLGGLFLTQVLDLLCVRGTASDFTNRGTDLRDATAAIHLVAAFLFY
ncbi:hypothetical protein C0J26_10760 [Pseudomonas baetica]|nr:hypothetical protein C0J26_10760 [Pseudomonas baetica]